MKEGERSTVDSLSCSLRREVDLLDRVLQLKMNRGFSASDFHFKLFLSEKQKPFFFLKLCKKKFKIYFILQTTKHSKITFRRKISFQGNCSGFTLK